MCVFSFQGVFFGKQCSVVLCVLMYICQGFGWVGGVEYCNNRHFLVSGIHLVFPGSF